LAPGIISRALAPLHLIAVASPAYLKNRVLPADPTGLMALDGIAWRSSRTGRIRERVMRNAAGTEIPVSLKETIVLDDPEATCRAALHAPRCNANRGLPRAAPPGARFARAPRAASQARHIPRAPAAPGRSKISRTVAASRSSMTSLRPRTRYPSGTWPPIQRPLRFEAAILSRMRSPVTSRSNWAKERSTLKVSRPMLVVVLKAWVTETKETPVWSKSSTSWQSPRVSGSGDRPCRRPPRRLGLRPKLTAVVAADLSFSGPQQSVSYLRFIMTRG
jgi:hypothetical protein